MFNASNSNDFNIFVKPKTEPTFEEPNLLENNLVEPKVEKIEWSRNTTLSFIEDYKQIRLLWDPSIKEYHVKSAKFNAIEQLSMKYGVEVATIRLKIKSLRSSFHRENGKIRSNEEKGIAYKPMWFAYDAMRFILEVADNSCDLDNSSNFNECDDRKPTMKIVSTESLHHFNIKTEDSWDADSCSTNNNSESCDDYKIASSSNPSNFFGIKTELVDDASSEFKDKTEMEDSKLREIPPKRMKPEASSNFFVEIPQYSSGFLRDTEESSSHNVSISEINSNHSQSTSKSPCNKTESKNIECLNFESPAPNQRDEYSVFGEYVGMAIRHLKTDTAKIVVKHYISQLLFQAEMGKYDNQNGILASKTFPSLPDDNP